MGGGNTQTPITPVAYLERDERPAGRLLKGVEIITTGQRCDQNENRKTANPPGCRFHWNLQKTKVVQCSTSISLDSGSDGLSGIERTGNLDLDGRCRGDLAGSRARTLERLQCWCGHADAELE